MTDSPRSCGTCYACCVWLGLDAPASGATHYPGQACSKLDGSTPTARCSIYSDRPPACARYHCSWLLGHFDSDDMRPDRSGLLATSYESQVEGCRVALTITVTDPAKAGTFDSGPLCDALTYACAVFDEVRVVNYASKSVLHFHHGTIWKGELFRDPKAGPESLDFITLNPPVGYYEVRAEQPSTTNQEPKP